MARIRKWEKGEIDTWVENFGRKLKSYIRCWFENYDIIPVKPWKRDKVARRRDIIRYMGKEII